MVFPIHEQGLRIHTPKNQVLQRPAIRQTQATTASRRLVDHDGDSEHDQNISDQTWLGRQLTAKEKDAEEGQEEKGQAPGRQRALLAYESVEQSRNPVAPHLPASHIMRSPVITLPATASLNEAWQVCQREGIHYLLLTGEDDTLEGIVHERDLLVEAAGVGELSKQEGVDLSKAQVRELIRKPLITASETTDVRDIARLMLKHKVRAVPVLNDQQELLGLVTRSDLMLGLANQRIELNT